MNVSSEKDSSDCSGWRQMRTGEEIWQWCRANWWLWNTFVTGEEVLHFFLGGGVAIYNNFSFDFIVISFLKMHWQY